MVAFNKEQMTCNGRGFVDESPNGLLKNFKDWVERVPVASPVAGSTGGPGWYIIEDASIVSGGSVNKYARLESYYPGVGYYFSTVPLMQGVTNGEFKITIGGVSNDITGLNFSGAANLDDAATILQSAIQAASVSPGDGYENAKVYHFKASRNVSLGVTYMYSYQDELDTIDKFAIIPGSPGLDIDALGTVTSPAGSDLSNNNHLHMDNTATRVRATEDPYIVISDNASPTPYDGSKIIRLAMNTSVAGEIYIDVFHNWDTDLHRGFIAIHNARLGTVDDGDFIYDFRGGPEMMVVQTRVGSTWYSFVLDEFTDLPDHIEDSTKRGSLAADVAVGATTFDVGVGEGSKFTVGESYFLIDFIKNEAVEFFKVEDVSGDTITVDRALARAFTAGSEVTAYHLRFYCCSRYQLLSDQLPNATIPLRRDKDHEFGLSNGGSVDFCHALFDYTKQAISDLAPNYKGQYAVQRPIVKPFHSGAYYDGKDILGRAKNMYYTAKGSMLQMANGRTINGEIFVYFQDSDDLSTYNGLNYISGLLPNTDKDS